MSDIEKYNCEYYYGQDGKMPCLTDSRGNEAKEGDYVRLEDYARLKDEAERLRSAINKFMRVSPTHCNPCGCGYWTCNTKDLTCLNDALEEGQSK